MRKGDRIKIEIQTTTVHEGTVMTVFDSKNQIVPDRYKVKFDNPVTYNGDTRTTHVIPQFLIKEEETKTKKKKI